MISVRLPKDIEESIEQLATYKHITKSEIIKEALVEYIASEKLSQTSYELGQDLFGRYGSDEINRSETYKKRLREKLNGKHIG